MEVRPQSGHKAVVGRGGGGGHTGVARTCKEERKGNGSYQGPSDINGNITKHKKKDKKKQKRRGSMKDGKKEKKEECRITEEEEEA
jgi:hypothetical protein